MVAGSTTYGCRLAALGDKKSDVRNAAAEALSQPAVLAMHARQVSGWSVRGDPQ